MRRFLGALFIVYGGMLLPHAAMAKAPIAGDNEPSITKHKTRSGETIYSQEFAIAAVTSGQPKFSIAEMYWLTKDQTKTLYPPQIAVTCPITDSGRVDGQECSHDWVPDWSSGKFLAMRIATSAGTFENLPQFSPVKYKGKDLFIRTVKFDVNVPKLERPEIDLKSGPLLEESTFRPMLKKFAPRVRYPSRALRQEADGLQRNECQVQSDYSIICTIFEFEPEENRALFEPELSEMFRKVKMEPFLPNGQPTKGARFRFNVNWRMPKVDN